MIESVFDGLSLGDSLAGLLVDDHGVWIKSIIEMLCQFIGLGIGSLKRSSLILHQGCFNHISVLNHIVFAPLFIFLAGGPFLLL